MWGTLLKHNWKTTIAGVLTGGMMGYAGYKTGNYELMVAGPPQQQAGYWGVTRSSRELRGRRSCRERIYLKNGT